MTVNPAQPETNTNTTPTTTNTTPTQTNPTPPTDTNPVVPIGSRPAPPLTTTTPASTTTTPVTTPPSGAGTNDKKTNGKDQSDSSSSVTVIFENNITIELSKSTKSGVFTLPFKEGASGKFTEILYQTVGTGKKAKKVEIAKGTESLKKAGKGSVKMKLTAKGKKALGQAVSSKAKLKVTADLTFKPTGKGLKTVHATKTKSVKF